MEALPHYHGTALESKLGTDSNPKHRDCLNSSDLNILISETGKLPPPSSYGFIWPFSQNPITKKEGGTESLN